MEKVINLLYDIEEKANHIVNRASEEKISLQDAFDKSLNQLDQSIDADNAAKLNLLKAQVDKELAKEKQFFIDDCNKQIADMEANYKQNHEALVNKVFQSLISA